MGTRHLIAVVVDGQYKVAQYGQWGGYPSGQGVSILAFLQGVDLPAFTEKVRAAKFIPYPELEALGERWLKVYPHQSRDVGSKILKIIADAKPGIGLRNSLPFAGDSLMCEYAYVIDLDSNQLEIFKGFNQEPLKAGERFYGMEGLEKSGDYQPVKFVKTYSLGDLPDEKTFLADLEPEEEEEA